MEGPFFVRFLTSHPIVGTEVSMSEAHIAFFIPLIAFLLDLLAGDPKGFPHPVRLIGRILEETEARIRSWNVNLFHFGILVLVLLCTAVWAVVDILCSIPFAGWLFSLYFAYAGLSLGQLLREGRKVNLLLKKGDVQGARQELSQLVSRDVTRLDEDGLRQTLAESLSENLNDGFVAPFLFLVVLGPPGLWVYKTVSTMDSMWGYRNEKYEKLGKAAARTDDVLSFIPARLTAFLLLGAGWFFGLPVSRAYDGLREDALKMDSPNAGWPMAASARLLGASMGGSFVYFKELKEKPRLGTGEGRWDDGRLHTLSRLLFLSGVLGALLMDAYFVAVLFVSGP